MAFSKPKEAKTSLGEVDMLSNLTEEVRVKILTYLKLDEAGRTSILSSKWRYTWTFIPELAISDDYIWGYRIYADSSSYAEEIRCRRFETFVDIIFVLHTGPIRKCKLSTMLPCYDGFDRWILNLSRNGIEELTLDIGYNGWTDYILNSSFFNCEKLSCVNLTQLAIIIPSWFKGFNHVHILALQFVLISAEDIGKLISSCPQMKILKLRDLRVDPFSLSIDAPNLESLELGGSFENILICGPKLESFELSASYSDLQIRAPKLISLFIEMIAPLGDNNGKKNFLQFLGEAPCYNTT